jgi:hypothetical protein
MIYLSVIAIYLILILIAGISLKRSARFLTIFVLTIVFSAAIFAVFKYLSYIPNQLIRLLHLIAIILVFLILFTLPVRIINGGTEALIERLGKPHRTLRPGINFIIPLLDYIVLKDSVREQILVVDKQQAITKDQAFIDIDTVIFWRIFDLGLTYYAIENVEQAIEEIAIKVMVEEVGKLDAEEIPKKLEKLINSIVNRSNLKSEEWGIRITDFIIQEISPSHVNSDLHSRQIFAKKIINLEFPDGILWDALQHSLFTVISANDGIELTVETIKQRKDGGVTIQVKVPQNIDKDKIESEINRDYGFIEKMVENILSRLGISQDEFKELKKQNSVLLNKLSELVDKLYKSTPEPDKNTTVVINGIVKTFYVYTNNSKNVNASRDLTLSGSSLNFGEINGNVTHSINQISDSNPENIRVKEILSEMQQTLTDISDNILSGHGKRDALAQIQILAQVAQESEFEKKTMGKKALQILERIVNATSTSLPVTTSLVEEMNKLIFEIASLFGL